ncbi:glutathione peroxidase 1-like [Anneissia japonica]|uniref:glutathione peroxidase 1-like n=1 Tax=Anneissia japonica TaxID=1529436 RepID=UPI0014258E55|nr:glutathione peroxidase 1-like [Anneissia japonica]
MASERKRTWQKAKVATIISKRPSQKKLNHDSVLPAITRKGEDNSSHKPEKLVPVHVIRSLYDLSGMMIGGQIMPFAKFEGKMVIVTNIASADKHCVRELTQLNELVTTYGSRGLTILAFPCNQFGHKEPWDNHEILTCLQHVRPGSNYIPKFQMMAKCDVNGAHANPIFEFLKHRMPVTSDDSENFFQEKHHEITWSPVNKSDIMWNFEKFLVGPDGLPVRRYTVRTRASALGYDIEQQIKRIAKMKLEGNKFFHYEPQDKSYKD